MLRHPVIATPPKKQPLLSGRSAVRSQRRRSRSPPASSTQQISIEASLLSGRSACVSLAANDSCLTARLAVRSALGLECGVQLALSARLLRDGESLVNAGVVRAAAGQGQLAPRLVLRCRLAHSLHFFFASCDAGYWRRRVFGSWNCCASSSAATYVTYPP